jgi:hypothetical protein
MKEDEMKIVLTTLLVAFLAWLLLSRPLVEMAGGSVTMWKIMVIDLLLGLVVALLLWW